MNICCLISLTSDFVTIKQIKADSDISLRIEESLRNEVGNSIDFSNDILKSENKIKGEPKVYYILRKYKNKGLHNILTDISEHVTLFQLMDSLENINDAISVVG